MNLQDLLQSAPGTEFDMQLTEDQLNELALTLLPGGSGMALEQAKISLRPGEVVVQATTRFSGIPLRVEVTGAPALDTGRLRLDVRQILLNGTPAPLFVQNQVAQSLNERLQGDVFPVEFDNLEVAEGVVTARGRRR